jgi:hypothetical protein
MKNLFISLLIVAAMSFFAMADSVDYLQEVLATQTAAGMVVGTYTTNRTAQSVALTSAVTNFWVQTTRDSYAVLFVSSFAINGQAADSKGVKVSVARQYLSRTNHTFFTGTAGTYANISDRTNLFGVRIYAGNTNAVSSNRQVTPFALPPGATCLPYKMTFRANTYHWISVNNINATNVQKYQLYFFIWPK